MASHKIISVEIVRGDSLFSDWKNPMQKIVTDKGTFIDNLPSFQFGFYNIASPGYDWQSQVGKLVGGIKIFSSRDLNWLNKQVDSSLRSAAIHQQPLLKNYDGMSSLDRELRDKLNNAFAHMGMDFAETLREFIVKSGMPQDEVYKRANIDRKVHSKIFTVAGYVPKQETVFAYAVALRLTLSETISLLESAGYAFRSNNVTDVIVREFISYGNYDLFAINDILNKYGQEILGSKMR